MIRMAENNPFGATIPSVFVIGSPLQALCLVGAVRNLQLSNFKVVVIHTIRHSQVTNVLEKYGIQYVTRYVGKYRWRMRWYRITSLIHRDNMYKRLFLGDFRNETFLYFGLQYISDGADIVYLDDGSATIPLFTDKWTTPPLGADTKYAILLTKYRHISFMKYFYSIYANIPNPKYEIAYNSLSILHSEKSKETGSIVYIIGTNTSMYCKSANVPETALYRVLLSVINGIKEKYPKERIVFIPHGKDTSEEVRLICEGSGVEFRRLDVPVELFFLDEAKPVAIYGFMSSALFNLKQMFPTSDVFNIFLPPSGDENSIAKYKSISNYYTQCGIEELRFEV